MSQGQIGILNGDAHFHGVILEVDVDRIVVFESCLFHQFLEVVQRTGLGASRNAGEDVRPSIFQDREHPNESVFAGHVRVLAMSKRRI